MSQQEDDLRALAKIMDFLRAISIILVVTNVYWFCHSTFEQWGTTIGVVDKILHGFDRTSGLYHSIHNSKLFALLLLALSCLGTKGVKNEGVEWKTIWIFLGVGLALFFLNWWIPADTASTFRTSSYIITSGCGFACILMAGIVVVR